MKVLFFTRKYPPSVGGMENQSYHLTKEIECAKKIISYGGSQFRLPLAMIKFMFQGLIYAKKFDVIHLSDSVLCKLGWLIKLIYKKPIAVNLHGLDITYNKWGYQTYLKLFGKKLDLYICNSINTKRLAEKHGFINTIVIPNGFTTPLPVPTSFEDKSLESLNTKGNCIYILTVGRLVARKGAAWFMENVFFKLPKNIKYLIVGEGKERYSIQHFITGNDLTDRIKLLGKVSDSDLEIIYHLTDMFVMPNIKVKDDVEGFGIVALEAAVRGIPVIAADVDGIGDAVKDNINGLLFPAQDADALFDKIMYFISNPEYVKEFSNKSKEYTQINYNWKKVTKLYLTAFHNLLNNNE